MREMNKKKRNIRIAIILILAAIIFLGITFSNHTFADPASETASPVDYSVTKQLTYPSIFDLLPANQRDGEYIYIRYEDLIKFPSVMCSARGVALPGYTSTLVHGKDRTDGGKLTGYLTLDDQGATVFKDGKIFHNEGNPYAPTSSKTYGKFKIVGQYKATPAESWVLSEMDMNDPEKNSIAYAITDQEWTDLTNIVDSNKHTGMNNTTLWAVEWDDTTNMPTRFVTESGGKYYVVTTDEYAPVTYVQYAWWKVKKVGIDETNVTLKDTDLAYEAEAFEEYIKRIAVYQTEENYRTVHGKDVAIGKSQGNDDNTIKVVYKNYTALYGTQKQLGYDASKYEVRFNAETNKYIVGPFTLDYLRAGTKQGTRDKVSFDGISQSSMFGLGADGERLLDSNGKSILQLQTAENPNGNYRFVYDHDHEAYIPTITTYFNGTASETKIDTADDYPYPYDGEEFYIEIDYLDDLVSLESLDFDFQYMNAGGEFEYLEGEFLIIHWVQRYNKVADDDTTSSSTSSSVVRKNSSISIGMADLSSRAAVNANTSENSGANGAATIGSTASLKTKDKSPIKASLKEISGDTGYLVVSDFDFDTEQFDITLKPGNNYSNGNRTEAGLYFDNLTWQGIFEKSGSGQEGTSKDFNIKIDRKFDAPYEKLTLNVVENYTKVWYEEKYVENSDPTKQPTIEKEIVSEKRSIPYKLTIEYYNNILQPEMNVTATGTINIQGSTIFLEQRGIINEADTIHIMKGNFNHGVEEIVCGGIYISSSIQSYGGWTNVGPWLAWKAPTPGPWDYKIQVIAEDGTVVQEFEYTYNVPKMYVNSKGLEYARHLITNGEIARFSIYNIWESCNFDNSKIGNPIICGVADSYNSTQGIFDYAPNLDALGSNDSVKGDNEFIITDGAGNKIRLFVYGTLYKNKEDDPTPSVTPSTTPSATQSTNQGTTSSSSSSSGGRRGSRKFNFYNNNNSNDDAKC